MDRLDGLHSQQANPFTYFASHDAQVWKQRQVVVGPAYSQGQITFGHMAGQLDAVALIGIVVKAKGMYARQHCRDGWGSGMDMANRTQE